MVSIGEVEFLVKFDTIGQSFTDAVKSSLKAGFKGDFDELKNELQYVKGYLGVLKTGWTGRYEEDLIKKIAYEEDFFDDDKTEALISWAKNNQTILNYISGQAKGVVVPGSDEAEEIAEREMPKIIANMADIVNRAFADKYSYKALGDKARKLIKMQDLATDDAMLYMYQEVLKLVAQEWKVDVRVAQELQGKGGAVARYGKSWQTQPIQTIDWQPEEDEWAVERETIKIEREFAGGEEEPEEKQVITDWDEFLEAAGKTIRKENIGAFFTSQAIEWTGTLRRDVMKMLQEYKLEPGDYKVPQAFWKTVAKIMGKQVSEIAGGKGRIGVPDVRVVQFDKEEAKKTHEKYKLETKTEEEHKEDWEKYEDFFDRFGFIYQFFENAKIGDIKKTEEDARKYSKQQQANLLGVSVFSSGGTKAIGLEVPERTMEEIQESNEEQNERIAEIIEESMQDKMEKFGDLLNKLPSDIKVALEAWTEGLPEEVKKKIKFSKEF